MTASCLVIQPDCVLKGKNFVGVHTPWLTIYSLTGIEYRGIKVVDNVCRYKLLSAATTKCATQYLDVHVYTAYNCVMTPASFQSGTRRPKHSYQYAGY